MSPPEVNFIMHLDWVVGESRKSSGLVIKLLEAPTILEPRWSSRVAAFCARRKGIVPYPTWTSRAGSTSFRLDVALWQQSAPVSFKIFFKATKKFISHSCCMSVTGWVGWLCEEQINNIWRPKGQKFSKFENYKTNSLR